MKMAKKIESKQKQVVQLLKKNGWTFNSRKGFLFRGSQRVRFEKQSVVFEVKQKPATPEQKEKYPCKAYFWKEVRRTGLAGLKVETEQINAGFDERRAS